jgi:hypothetical protein
MLEMFAMAESSHVTSITAYINNELHAAESLRAGSSPASQDIQTPFMEIEDRLPCSEQPITDAILSQTNPVYILTYCFAEIDFNIISSSTPCSPKYSSLHVFQLKFCMDFSFLTCVTRALPTSLNLDFMTLIIIIIIIIIIEQYTS